MSNIITNTETSRLKLTRSISRKQKNEFGQFLTPSSIASFMASLFQQTDDNIRLLDAGAGIGSLSNHFLERWLNGNFKSPRIDLEAYEIDKEFVPFLISNLDHYENEARSRNLTFTGKVTQKDFVETAVTGIQFQSIEKFSHIILNPPYKKIRNVSRHRRLLRNVGIETVNLYSAFVALSIKLLKKQGELVAIIPRSFCNGPYYFTFRKLLLSQTSIRHIHLFSSRKEAFKDDSVLQENVIIHLSKGETQDTVAISQSMDATFSDYKENNFPFDRIVDPDDSELFIRIPSSTSKSLIETSKSVNSTLSDLSINISTGPVVDFRVKDFLEQKPVIGNAPLIYPCHFTGIEIEWPKDDIKKPNSIKIHKDTVKWLFPIGYYVVVRRFSSKEEKRRVVANIVTPTKFPGPYLGFENHLNVFHKNKEGMSKELAYGLVVYLNSYELDKYFRTFSGHTQVNATDLRNIKYPSSKALVEMGNKAINLSLMSQNQVESLMSTVL